MLAAVAQSVLRFQVLLAKAGGEEDLWHDVGDVLLKIFQLLLFQRGEIEEFCCLSHGLNAGFKRSLQVRFIT